MILPATIQNIAQAAEFLRMGDVVGMPTETVYGLAANAFDAVALAKIFEVKERPSFDPLILHIANLAQAGSIAEFNPLAEKLAEAFWPGPLTLVLPKKSSVPDIATSGLDTVGVRMPSHPVARALINKSGLPLAAPSANLFGRISPTTARHVEDQLGDLISMTLDGGPCELGLESTIVEVLDDEVRLLRAGLIERAQIEALGIRVEIGQAIHEKPNAPGMLKSHYAPEKPLRLVPSLAEVDANPRTGVLAFQAGPEGFGALEILSTEGDLREAAANLFAAMRRLEASDIDEIVVEELPEVGVGLAIMDRLRRAASEL